MCGVSRFKFNSQPTSGQSTFTAALPKSRLAAESREICAVWAGQVFSLRCEPSAVPRGERENIHLSSSLWQKRECLWVVQTNYPDRKCSRLSKHHMESLKNCSNSTSSVSKVLIWWNVSSCCRPRLTAAWFVLTDDYPLSGLKPAGDVAQPLAYWFRPASKFSKKKKSPTD